MKNWLNQDVIRNTKKQIKVWFLEKSGKKGKLSFFWCFQTAMDLMSKLNSKFEQIWFSMR